MVYKKMRYSKNLEEGVTCNTSGGTQMQGCGHTGQLMTECR